MKFWRFFCTAILLTMSPLFAQIQQSFQVDMRVPLRHHVLVPDNGDFVVVRGVFNGWQGNAFVLQDAFGDSIYSATFTFSEGMPAQVEYKFVIHKSDGTDIWERNPEPSNPPYGNRRLDFSQPTTKSSAIFDLEKYYLDEDYLFSVQELQADFDGLRLTIEGLHPALYAFTDKATFDELFDRYRQRITEPMNGIAFYRLVAPLVARIGCGHSSVYMPGAWWAKSPDHFAPFQIRIIDGRAYVLRALHPDSELPAGVEIAAINDVPIEQILQRFSEVISADGYNRNYQNEQIHRRFADFYALHFGQPERFLVSYRADDCAGVQTADLPAVTREQARKAVDGSSRLQFDFLDDGDIAVLTINSFAYYQNEAQFEAFIDSVFAQMREHATANLVLDLRDNNGGHPFSAAYLLSYLEHEPVRYFAEPYGKYSILAKPVARAVQPFDGTLYTLINGQCFSTTGHLTAVMKQHQIGTFVGSETGGTYTCNDAKTTIPLPNTGIQLQVAQGTFAAAVQDMPRSTGVMPDIYLEPTIDDLLQGRDAVKQYVVNLIRESGKSAF